MVILLKIKRRDFFNETAFLFWCHALWKLGSSNCCIFEMKHAMGLKTCTKINFLIIFNLVLIRIRKPRYFDFSLLMTSLWKPSIKQRAMKFLPLLGWLLRFSSIDSDDVAVQVQHRHSNHLLSPSPLMSCSYSHWNVFPTFVPRNLISG